MATLRRIVPGLLLLSLALPIEAAEPSQASEILIVPDEQPVDLAALFDPETAKMLELQLDLLSVGEVKKAATNLPALQALLDGGQLVDYQSSVVLLLMIKTQTASSDFIAAALTTGKLLQFEELDPQDRIDLQISQGKLWAQGKQWQKSLDTLLPMDHPALLPPDALYAIAVSFYQLKEYRKATTYAEKAIALGRAKPNEQHYRLLRSLYEMEEDYLGAESLTRDMSTLFVKHARQYRDDLLRFNLYKPGQNLGQ